MIIVVAVAAVFVLTGLGFVGWSRQRARKKALRAQARGRGKADLASIMQGAKEIHAKAKELAPVVKDSIQSISAWASSFKPGSSDLAPDGTITVLFSDIQDSTAINSRLGDERWMEELRSHTRVVGELAKAHHGQIVKSQGDGFMLVFKDPGDAVRFAVDLQQAMAESAETAPEREPLQVRVGIHTGPAISEKGDYFGENVAFAARVAQAASGGEVLVSASVRDRVEEDPSVALSPPRAVEMKGIEGSQKVFAIEW